MSTVTIDFVTIRPDGSHCLRLREEGPWSCNSADALRAIQTRLYDAVEVVVDGKFVERYPESKGKKVHVVLDCFRLPRETMDPFFARFVSAIRSSPEWAPGCEAIEFRISHLEADPAA